MPMVPVYIKLFDVTLVTGLTITALNTVAIRKPRTKRVLEWSLKSNIAIEGKILMLNWRRILYQIFQCFFNDIFVIVGKSCLYIILNNISHDSRETSSSQHVIVLSTS